MNEVEILKNKIENEKLILFEEISESIRKFKNKTGVEIGYISINITVSCDLSETVEFYLKPEILNHKIRNKR